MSASPAPPNWPTGKYGAIYCDPPWTYKVWSAKGTGRSAEQHYETMETSDLMALPVESLAAPDCVLFMWSTWPTLPQGLEVIKAWGFEYKTAGFDWCKADASQMDLFRDDLDVSISLGHWTRSNTEPCLLATRGHPKRVSASVRQAIIEPRREHSRKPDCVYLRIECLVNGPYCELFARTTRPGWDAWGRDVGMFAPVDARQQALL